MHGRARKGQYFAQTSMWTSQCATLLTLFFKRNVRSVSLCVTTFLYALRSVFILKLLLYFWKRLDSRKNTLISLSAMLEFSNYVSHTPKSSFKSFPANFVGPQNWLWRLWTHSPEGHEFKSQVGDGGGGAVMVALFFLADPSPTSFPHLTRPSFHRLDKRIHEAMLLLPACIKVRPSSHRPMAGLALYRCGPWEQFWCQIVVI